MEENKLEPSEESINPPLDDFRNLEPDIEDVEEEISGLDGFREHQRESRFEDE